MTERIDLTLESIAHGGEAIGRHAGKTIFVPYAIPGERVRVEIVEEKERWARARLLEVLEPSQDRVEPPCPYFGPDRCGGCQWQHIAYPRQAELKQAIVADQLQRLGRITDPPVADIIALADPAGQDESPQFLAYGYRNHAQFALTPQGQTGFRRAIHGAATHGAAARPDIIPIERCLLLHDRLDELHAALDVDATELGVQAISLRAGINTEDALILLDSSVDDLPELTIDLPAAVALRTPHGVQPLIGQPWLTEEVLGRIYRVSAESVFQVNTVGAAALVDVVTAYAAVQPADVLLDAYCGVGLFSLALAGAARAVVGIEASPSACEDFAVNVAATAGDRPNIELHEGPVEEVLPALQNTGLRVDVAVLDPPLGGAGAVVIHELAALGPRRIVYVSGDPATLARDAVYLAQAGYHLVEAQPIDLFPQTYHVETVALWLKGLPS